MHPEVVMDHPGNCPKCGMKLVPLKEEKPKPHAKIDNYSMHAAMKHDGHDHDMANHEVDRAAASHGMEHEEMQMSMQSSVNIADPMSRESSGTAWVPDSTPMYGKMFMFGDDMLMLHGAIFPRYTNVSTRRGDDRIDAPNWIMGMYSHPLGDSAQFGARLMMSLDPLTEGGRGYPLLFQSGESWNDPFSTTGEDSSAAHLNRFMLKPVFEIFGQRQCGRISALRILLQTLEANRREVAIYFRIQEARLSRLGIQE